MQSSVRSSVNEARPDTLGAVHFEIANHLGNVLAVVGDRKLWVSSTAFNFDHYLADLYSVQDYDPFGMGIPERSWSAPEEEGYRFGFNGQEKSREINGTESSFTAEFWEYDARIIRRRNPDPRPNPSMSDYAVFGCNPLMFVDTHGDSAVVFGPDGTYINRIDDGRGNEEWSIIHTQIKARMEHS